MPPADIPTNTAMLRAATRGDEAAEHDLLAVLHAELKGVASALLRGERADHTLQPTALVHEAWLRLRDQRAGFHDQGHVMAVAALTMRRVLVDHARARLRLRRGGGRLRLDLDEGLVRGEVPDGDTDGLDLLALDEALERLAAQAPRQASVVELRFFGGLPSAAIAARLGITDRTVRNDWAFARAWLHRELRP